MTQSCPDKRLLCALERIPLSSVPLFYPYYPYTLPSPNHPTPSLKLSRVNFFGVSQRKALA